MKEQPDLVVCVDVLLQRHFNKNVRSHLELPSLSGGTSSSNT